MQATVKVADINIRAPNNEVVVTISCCGVNSGRRKMNPKMNINSIESLRPTLSTIIADKTSPGTSENKRKSCYANFTRERERERERERYLLS